jgi:mevalonate kinase
MADERMTVTVSAPGKLMLLGEHAVVYGRPCLVTAVDRRMWVSVEETRDGLLHLSGASLGVEDWTVLLTKVEDADPPAGVRFLHAVARCLARRHALPPGLRIEARSDFSDELGLGSSAAVTIAATAALSELLGLRLSKDALFSLGYEAVRAVQGVGSGFDLAASLYGGTVYFRPPPHAGRKAACAPRCPGPVIVPLNAHPLPLLVGYSGTKADTVSLVHRVARRRERQPALIHEIFEGMARLVEEGREALVGRDWQRLGQAMSLGQSLLDALGVSTPKLAQLVRVAEEAGAYGAKLSGAGGGDCMIALVSDERRVEVARAIGAAGGEVIQLRMGAAGTQEEGSQRISMADICHSAI